MNKLILIFSLIICYNALEYEDCSYFNTIEQQSCGSLSNATFNCLFSDGKCFANYKQCSGYNPSQDKFVDNDCKAIISTTANKKCVVKTVNNVKSCEEEDKNCEDFTIGDDCKSLKAEDNKRCVLYKGECKAHSEECEGLSSNECIKNIPKDNSKKCVWDTSTSACKPIERTCTDYIIYEDKYDSSLDCKDINIEDPNICFLDGENCISIIPNCEDRDSSSCTKSNPLNDAKSAYDITKQCIYDTSCTSYIKKCNDYKKGERDCNTIVVDDTDNKMCVLEGDKCKEVYITCDKYNELVEEDNRDSNQCAAITPRDETTKIIDYFSKCALIGGECTSVARECSEFNNDESLCNSHKQDKDKICIFKNNLCQEQFKTCELYDSQENKNKGGCESILPKYSSSSIQKCIYNEETCQKERMECEDYKGTDESFCKSISTNDTNVYKCIFRNNKCIAEFKGCNTYDGKDRKICESIKLDNEYQKCILEKDEDCTVTNKLCSDYLGNEEFECISKYFGSDDLHSCKFINNKCYDPSIYKYCSDYKGSNKLECESIQPYKYNEENGIDSNSRCIFKENEGCIRQSYKCSDAKSESHCNSLSSIYPTESKKKCVFINNQCKEQYKTCEDYAENEEVIDPHVCESMVVDDILINKCVYGAPAEEGEKGSCTTGNKICSDFKIELLNSQCITLTLLDHSKKCEFSNNICSDTKKNCDEMEAGSSNEICNSAIVSAKNHLCIKKQDNSGCEEIINPNYSEPTTSPTQTSNPNNPNNQQTQTQQQQQETQKTETNENNDNSGGKNLTKIMLYFLWILL